ncbi:hypothetical protein [Jiella sp. M17.18]|uniref:hypothetical protein n=1 Tax=Jiella sp. M17.18 TaxID=3234247 RepID=UPI0034DFB1E7
MASEKWLLSRASPRNSTANERSRLTATWLNVVAAGVITTGVVSPLMTGILSGSPVPLWLLLAASSACLSLGVLLHVIARGMVGRLRP